MRKQNAKVVSSANVSIHDAIMGAISALHATVERLDSRVAALEAPKVAPKGPRMAPKGPKAAKPKASAPQFIKEFAAKKAARRQLAAWMRANKIEITEASWKAAKAEHGIA
jgi:hypothetical protein